MKIGILSDTHIPERAKELPPQIIEAFKNVDMILHAGDLVDIKVVDKLKSLCKNVHAVWGNMDSPATKTKLPEKEIITVGKFRIGLTHGYGAPIHLKELMAKIFKNEKVNIIVFGHSHNPTNEMIKDVLYFNPGSSTDTVFAPYTSYGLIEINEKINAKIIKI